MAHSLPPVHTLTTYRWDLGLSNVMEVEAGGKRRLDGSNPSFFFSPPVAERALSHLPPIQPAPFSTGVRAVDRNVLLQRTLLKGETCSLLQTQTR